MTVDKIDSLLNDSEINYIADLFLARLGFVRGTQRYRLFRNAVVLLSHGVMSYAEALPRLAACADVATSELSAELMRAIAELPVPIHEAFNAAYSLPPNGEAAGITMAANVSADYIITFLGTALMYVLVTNYPKLHRVTLLK